MMIRTRNIAVAIFAALIMAFAFVVVPASNLPGGHPTAVAAAADCHLAGIYCGRIRNADGTGDGLHIGHYGHGDVSDGTFYVEPLWVLPSSGNSWETGPGEPGWDDTDGYLVQKCWRWRLSKVSSGVTTVMFYVYEGFHKVPDQLWGSYWRLDGGVKIC